VRALMVGVGITALLAGCSSSGTGDEPTQAVTSAATRQATEAATTAPAGLAAADVRRAEDAVENELPDIPLWEGTTFKGTIVNDSTVCVDRFYPEGGGVTGKGGSAGYVLVTFPALSLGKPKDGLCKDVSSDPAPTSAPVRVPDDVKDEPGLVTRDDLGEDWPLTVDYAVLGCEGGTVIQAATLTAPDGTVYALNGTAKDHTDYEEDIDPIWADASGGLKVNIGPLIEQARALC
jgi:Protein of unknown function (DUF2511)